MSRKPTRDFSIQSTVVVQFKLHHYPVYPWAGQDRSATAPNIAIVKAGYKTLFAHPADVKKEQQTTPFDLAKTRPICRHIFIATGL